MLGEGFLNGDALEPGLALGFLTFNRFMVCKVLKILGVGVGFFGLGLGCGVVLFCPVSVSSNNATDLGAITFVVQEEL